MAHLFRVILCSLVFTAPLRAAPEVIADAANAPAWRDLFAHLAARTTRLSAFEERRYFSFRKEAVVLTGEIRIDPELGLSLRYLTPETQTLIIDSKGLLMRDDRGRERAAPDDHRAAMATSTLVNVLRFDLPALQKTFEIRGEREGDAWTLAFSPRDAALAKTLGSLVVRGEKLRLQRIEMQPAEKQRIEIIIGETNEGVIFTSDTLKRFFR
ncbi:MAG TPA: outer membrane lipoprotein carrier protein LolA [Opitutaceae bacterium]|nr:outer membrane lipoprotein carrier protein LolA [Opitutaceae bacterium]